MTYTTVYIVIMENGKVHNKCWDDLAAAQRQVGRWGGTIVTLQLESNGDSGY